MSLLDDDFEAPVAPTIMPKPTKPAPGADPIDALVSDYLGATRNQATSMVLDASDANPDTAGRAATIAPLVGSPFAEVEQDVPGFDAQLTTQRNALIISKNHAIASWIADDFKNARIAKDDFDKLDFVTKGIEALRTGWSGAFDQNERARQQARFETGFGDDSGFSALDKRLAANPKLAGVYGALQSATGFAGGLLDSLFRAGDEATVGLATGAALGAAATAEAGGVGAAPGGVSGALIGLGVGFNTDQSLIAAGNFYMTTANMRNDAGEPLDPAARHGAAALVFLTSYALNSLGENLIGKSASTAAADLIATAIARPTIGRALARFTKTMGASALEGAAIFSAMEGTNIFAEEFAKQLSAGTFEDVFNSEQVRNDAVMRMLSAATTGAIFLPFAKLPFAGTSLVMDSLRARQASTDIAVLQNLEDGAAQSLTRTRNLDAFNRFVAAQTDGSPIENISIPAAKVLELYQSNKLEPGKDDALFGKFVPDIKEQIEQGIEAGGDVIIPLSGYITHMAGSDLANSIRNDLRLRPEGMTLNEAEAYLKDRGRMLEDNAADMQTALAHVFNAEDPVQAVYDDAFGQLRRAGHTIDASRQYAALIASRYRTRAERMAGIGGDALAMYQKEGLEIRRELPRALRNVKVDHRDVVIDALRRGDKLPNDRQLFGPTVIEFIRKRGGIVDTGGELASMDLGRKGAPASVLAARAAGRAAAKGGKKAPRLTARPGFDAWGMPTGVIRDVAKHGGPKAPFGLDETGLALWEAGYFTGDERPSPQDVLDAIADEIAGNKRYQIGTDREAEAMFRQAVEDLDDFLGRNDLDVNKLTNTQIKKLLADHEAAGIGKAFDQAAWHGSPHEFDQFTLDHMGTGEGAQAYGWGLYFAGNKAVAKYYHEMLADVAPIEEFSMGSVKIFNKGEAVNYSSNTGLPNAAEKASLQEAVLAAEHDIREAFKTGGVEAVRKAVTEIVDYFINDENQTASAKAYYQRIKDINVPKMTFTLGKRPGRVYRVDLAPKPSEMLDWDSKIDKQPSAVKKLAYEMAKENGHAKTLGGFRAWKIEASSMAEADGEFIYRKLSERLAIKEEPKEGEGVPKGWGGVRQTVNDRYANDKGASLHLLAQGVRGIRYKDQFSRAGETKPSHNFVIFDAADITMREYEQSERGKINMSTGKAIITLFRDADLSTTVHELGHLWLDEMSRDYLDAWSFGRGDDPAMGGALEVGGSVKADFEAILKWMGVDTPGEIQVEHHEKFARAFEAYLLEGKAPSTALGRAFKAFKQWMTRIYREVALLQTPINDTLRGVFDRMLATDEEIKTARDREALNPVFASAGDAGMTEAEFKAYTNGIAKAQQEGDRKLLDKTMKAVREARTKEWETERAAIREEVKGNVTSRPDLRAEHWLRTGRSLNDAPIAAGIQHARLSREALLHMYGSENAHRLLPDGVTTVKGGLHPDDAATLFGYRNGDELVQALMTLEAARDGESVKLGKPLPGTKYVTHLIDAETDEQMLSRHGDALNDGSIEEEAIAAVHNKAQAEVMATELKAIARKVGRNPLDLVDMKGWVDEQIDSMPVTRATNNAAFIRQEGQSGREVQRALLKGDVRKAFLLKQRQLLNHLMVTAANEAKADFEAATKLFLRYAGKSKFGSLDQGYVDQIHALLKRMGFPTKRQDAELSSGLAGVTLRQFVDGKLAEGFEIVAPDFLLDPLWTKRPRDMTMSEVRGVYDVMTTMIHSARLEKTAELDGKRVELQALYDEASDQMRDLPQMPDDSLTKEGAAIRSPAVSTGRMDALRAKAFNFKTGLRQVGAALRKIEEVVDILDEGVGSAGVFNRVIFKPIADAQHKANDMRTAITAKWLALRDGMSEEWRRALLGPRKVMPELKRKDGRPWAFSKSELLMIALNTGADSNFQKMLKGEGWDEQSVRAVLDRNLSLEDWKFVQSTLDIVNSLWPEIESMQRRLTGLGPDKVEARTIETAKHGSFPGGYFPVMYDAALAPDVEARARTAASKLFDEDYQGIATPRGHTKRRIEDYARPMSYDFGRIAQHLESVIHDLSFREPVMQAQRFVTNKDMRAGMVGVVGKENYDAFMPWLKHIANEKAIDARGLGWFDRFAKGVRMNATMVGLAFRMSTMLMQITGFSDSAEMIGAKGVGKGFVQAYGFRSPLEAISAGLRGVSATAAGKTIGAKYLAMGFDAISGSPRKFQIARDFVVERSGEMRHRFETLDRDIKAGLEGLLGKKGLLSDARRFGYYGIGMMDHVVTIPTWLGAYEKAMAEGKPEADAIYYADKVVRGSQGAGGAKDLAAVQRSHNEWFKLATMFYSYMNHMVNRMFSIARQAKSGARNVSAGEWKAARSDFAMVLARSWFLLVVPAVAGPLLAGRGPREEEDPATWAMRKVFFNLWGGVPLVRDFANAVENYSTGQFGSDYQFTPAERMADAFLRTGADSWNATFGDNDVSDKWLKHSIETAGYAFGLPGAGQAATSAQYLWDTADGKEQPDDVNEFIGSVLFGPPPKGKK